MLSWILSSYMYDKTNFHKKLPNYQGGTILKRQISQNCLKSDLMRPESKKYFNALDVRNIDFALQVKRSDKF